MKFRQVAKLLYRNTHCNHTVQLLSTSLGEKTPLEACLEHSFTPCSSKEKKSYNQESILGKHMSRSHLYTNSTTASGTELTSHRSSLLYKQINTNQHCFELMGAPAAYSSALHRLSTTKSLDKDARAQNPHGIAGSNHWNCVYCHLHTASHNSTDFWVFRFC